MYFLKCNNTGKFLTRWPSAGGGPATWGEVGNAVTFKIEDLQSLAGYWSYALEECTPVLCSEFVKSLKMYVWDRNGAGAYITVAQSAQEAADKWNATYPQGMSTRHGKTYATAEVFIEYALTGLVTTEGDC